MFLSLTSDLKPGEVRPLPYYNNKQFIVNDNGQFKIGNNVCPHQGSRIVSSKTDNIKCQYHGWSWDSKGNPTGAGTTPLCNNKRISLSDLHTTEGMVFSSPTFVPELPVLFNDFSLVEHRVDQVKVNDPRHIMNIFLDVDHIPIVHKNVYDKMGIVGDPDVEWEIFNNGSIQKVFRSDDPTRPLVFMWISIYPYTMIEWQQGSMFITDVIKSENNVTEVAVYKYKEASSTDWAFNESTWETAWAQDKVQAEQMAVMNSGMLEDQKRHFLQWMEKHGPYS